MVKIINDDTLRKNDEIREEYKDYTVIGIPRGEKKSCVYAYADSEGLPELMGIQVGLLNRGIKVERLCLEK